MPIYHEWNGTILTITSDSGTSSANLKGDKGDDGARGAQGIPGSSLATDAAMLGGVPAANYALKSDIDEAVVELSIDDYAKKEALNGLATELYVEEAIAKAVLENGEVNLDAYATKTYVDEAAQAININLETNYALKDEIPQIDLSPYATKTYVDAFNELNHTYVDNSINSIKPAYDYNYIDNGDFTNPVNQRDIVEAASGNYILDRWIFLEEAHAATVALAINNTGTTITSASGTQCGICQRFEDANFYDGKYTFMVLTNAGLHIGTVEAEDTTQNLYKAILWVPSGTRLIWAAMYEGQYSTLNFPHYKKKGYAAELRECQRYYRRVGGGNMTGFMTSSSCNVALQLENPMRITPSLMVKSRGSLRGGGKNIDIDTITVLKYEHGRLLLTVTYAEGAVNHAAVLAYGADLVLSADL